DAPRPRDPVCLRQPRHDRAQLHGDVRRLPRRRVHPGTAGRDSRGDGVRLRAGDRRPGVRQPAHHPRRGQQPRQHLQRLQGQDAARRHRRPGGPPDDAAAALPVERPGAPRLAGPGAATPAARTALVQIAEATGARVYGERLPVRSVFPTDHPQYVGMLLSLSQLRAELGGADVVLIAGARKFASLLYTPAVQLPPRMTVIHLDTDPWEIGKNIPVTLGIVGDLAAILPAIAARLADRMTPERRQAAAARAAEVRRERGRREEEWRAAASPPA